MATDEDDPGFQHGSGRDQWRRIIFKQLGELGCLRLFEENREDRGRIDHH
jgi:hypothetical protein